MLLLRFFCFFVGYIFSGSEFAKILVFCVPFLLCCFFWACFFAHKHTHTHTLSDFVRFFYVLLAVNTTKDFQQLTTLFSCGNSNKKKLFYISLVSQLALMLTNNIYTGYEHNHTYIHMEIVYVSVCPQIMHESVGRLEAYLFTLDFMKLNDLVDTSSSATTPAETKKRDSCKF